MPAPIIQTGKSAVGLWVGEDQLLGEFDFVGGSVVVLCIVLRESETVAICVDVRNG